MAQQEKIDAVLALFTPIDVVHDLVQPGGMVCSAFVDDYTGLTSGFEKVSTPFYHMLSDFSYDFHLVLGVGYILFNTS